MTAFHRSLTFAGKSRGAAATPATTSRNASSRFSASAASPPWRASSNAERSNSHRPRRWCAPRDAARPADEDAGSFPLLFLAPLPDAENALNFGASVSSRFATAPSTRRARCASSGSKASSRDVSFRFPRLCPVARPSPSASSSEEELSRRSSSSPSSAAASSSEPPALRPEATRASSSPSPPSSGAWSTGTFPSFDAFPSVYSSSDASPSVSSSSDSSFAASASANSSSAGSSPEPARDARSAWYASPAPTAATGSSSSSSSYGTAAVSRSTPSSRDSASARAPAPCHSSRGPPRPPRPPLPCARNFPLPRPPVCPRFHAPAAVSFCSRAALPAAERGIL